LAVEDQFVCLTEMTNLFVYICNLLCAAIHPLASYEPGHKRARGA
jgi:hypothetical protein